MRKLNLFLVFLVACALVVLQAQDNPQPLAKGNADPMVTLVNDVCASCHNLDRVNNKKADAAGWGTTVTRMQGKGADVTDEQIPLLVDYLVKNAGTLAVAAGPAKGGAKGAVNGGGGNNASSSGKNLKVLKGPDVAATMPLFVRDLGLLEEGTCAFCHVADRSSDEKMTKVIARDMLVMVKEINAKFPDGKQHVTCFTCHRGSIKPLTAP
jgi:hypothetical protein